MSQLQKYLEEVKSKKDTFGITGKYLAVKIEYGDYETRGLSYDERLYQFIQEMGGNYTTDNGSKPKYLYLFDSEKTGLKKEELALALRDEMGYDIYLKANIDKEESVEKINRKDLELATMKF